MCPSTSSPNVAATVLHSNLMCEVGSNPELRSHSIEQPNCLFGTTKFSIGQYRRFELCPCSHCPHAVAWRGEEKQRGRPIPYDAAVARSPPRHAGRVVGISRHRRRGGGGGGPVADPRSLENRVGGQKSSIPYYSLLQLLWNQAVEPSSMEPSPSC
eukprot:SAG11_NODE_9794_length_880_cov_1.032010_2_plen_156_part_00